MKAFCHRYFSHAFYSENSETIKKHTAMENFKTIKLCIKLQKYKTTKVHTKLKTLKLLNSKACYTGCLFLTCAPLKAPKCQITKKIPLKKSSSVF